MSQQKTIALPATAYEEHLPHLMAWLAKADGNDEITLNFESVRFYTPGALVMLLAKLQWWDSQNKTVLFENCEKCPAFGYLQRIDFFPKPELTFLKAFAAMQPADAL